MTRRQKLLKYVFELILHMCNKDPKNIIFDINIIQLTRLLIWIAGLADLVSIFINDCILVLIIYAVNALVLCRLYYE